MEARWANYNGSPAAESLDTIFISSLSAEPSGGEGYMFAVCGIGAFFLRFRGMRTFFLRFCGFSKTVAVCGFGLIYVRFCGMKTF